jgi:hypothetical protein
MDALNLKRCKFCLKKAELVKKSHIIPKSFLKWVMDEDFKMVKIQMNKDETKGRDIYNAFYQGDILCRSCENLFSKDENYTYRFIDKFRRGAIRPIKTTNDNQGVSFYYNIDVKRIKFCLLSILWRMAISSREEFLNVNIDKIVDKLRVGLLTDNYMNERFFPVSLISTKNVNNVKASILCPPNFKVKFQHRLSYVYTYSLLLPDMVVIYYTSDKMKLSVENIGIKLGDMLEVGQANNSVMYEFYDAHFKQLPNVTRFK